MGNAKFRFVGAGNIVRAILSGVAMSGQYANGEIGIYDIAPAVREEFAAKGYEIFGNTTDLAKDAEVIVMAVIPQVIGSVLEEMKALFNKNTVILSVVAGISFAWYRDSLGDSCKVVRCMPTLTAQSGMGSFAVCKTDSVSEEEFKTVEAFLASAGIVEQIPETLMTPVVALNGSAPGYFYHMANVVVEEAVRMGFDENTALRLFAQTMKGSAETLLNSGLSRQELEKRLRLPGGTTIAALEKMEELGFDRCMGEGLRACAEKCAALERGE